ncbi:hypothetical protein [Methylobacterium sp. J-090]|uniref:hypothetical protein n=1 Tax=Methylobacterium sp. J-090 TaxID=2836666 RepID=UPI001FBAADA8|nr:hypothetical protein [Methylobacterium sp. J-090]MCJ2083252.1 hypothetical protein [Methylobacterium sp. J-090]
MRPSKLERYYQAEFGPRDDPDADEAPPPRGRRPEREARHERSARRGVGPFKLVLLLGSLGFFAASVLMPCGAGNRPGFLPQGLVSAVCARQEVAGHVLGLEDRFRSISNALR